MFYRPGEWVEPGKPVVRLVRLDRLRVEGFVRYDQQSPGSLHGKTVRAEIASAGGVRHSFSGRVTFVSPIVQPGGEYRIWAEVENRRENEHWLLRPGLEAELTIE
ncbi:MAG: HlyD family secretion protein [Pirellulales bacterium]